MIEKGIPIPPPQPRHRRPFKLMEIGDSMVFERPKARHVSIHRKAVTGLRNAWKARHGLVFVQAFMEDEECDRRGIERGSIRIWRTK